MKPEALASCANCWFNGLQHGSVGLSVGYCTEHRVVLRRPEETTCARHMRKDLLLKSSEAFNIHHKRIYMINDGVQRLSDRERATNGEYLSKDVDILRSDAVGDAVADYGEYDTKIESLAQLRNQATLRSEFAMLNLARAYTRRCVQRQGNWTSGVHILWWTRRQLASDTPPVKIGDLRYAAAASLERQQELAQWSLLMFRIVFISDIGAHAASRNDDFGRLESMAEVAAEDTETPNLRKLQKWIRTKGLRWFDSVMPEPKYRALVSTLIRPDSARSDA